MRLLRCHNFRVDLEKKSDVLQEGQTLDGIHVIEADLRRWRRQRLRRFRLDQGWGRGQEGQLLILDLLRRTEVKVEAW